MSDLPSYDYNNDEKEGKIKLNKENAENIQQFINNMNNFI